MIRISRLIILMLILTALWGCVSNENNPIDRLIDQTSAIDDNNISNQLVDLLTRERINLLGEIHNIQETQELYGKLVPGLHTAGVRVILLEAPVYMGPVWNSYVRGETHSLPWEDHPIYHDFFAGLIENVAKFNHTLRESGLAEDQIKLYSYDGELFEDKAYGWLVRFLRRDAGLDNRFFQRPKDNLILLESDDNSGLSSEMKEDFLWLTKQKISFDSQSKGKYNQAWNFKDKDQINNYLTSQATVRESFMEDNVRYYLDKYPTDKFLIITGALHAQRIAQIKPSGIDQNPLCQRLLTIGYEINSVMLTHYRIKTMETTPLGVHPIVRDNHMTTSAGELFEALVNTFGETWLMIDLKPLANQELMINTSLAGDIDADSFHIDLPKVFDGLVIIPEGRQNNTNFLNIFFP